MKPHSGPQAASAVVDQLSQPSLSSHPLALSDQTLLIVNSDSNSLTLLDIVSRSVIAELPVGVNPRSVALYENQAYVANRGSDTISIIDLSQPAVSATLAVGDRPVATAISPDGRFLAVAESGADRVRIVDMVTLTTLSTHPVLDRPFGLSFTPDGEFLLVSHLLDGTVSRLAVRPYANYLPIARLESGTRLEYSEEHQGFSRPVVHLESALDEESLTTTIPTWPGVAPAPTVIVNAAGTRAYVPQTMANGLGLNTQFDNTVFPKISVLNLETWQHQTSEHISLPETDRPVGLPWDVALARDDSEVWLVNSGSSDVSVIDIGNPVMPIRRAHIRVGGNPRGIILSRDESEAYVSNWLDGTVTVINSSTYTVTAVIQVTDNPLPPLLLQGKRLFHSSDRPELAQAGWISCNTCHVEGEHDGRTWLIQYLGQIPPGGTPVITRNTTSLLGMIETYPLRWSAEWDESADSEFSVRFEQFGTGLIDGEMHPSLGAPNQGRSEELDALAAYIDALVLPRRTHELSEAELRGQLLFMSPLTQCSTCHPPPRYTDLQQHDVGTADASGEWFGPAIDTPSLRFLYDSPPYLHDGSAASLLDVLTTANPADEHGQTSQLTTQELDDLASFLLSLPYES